MRAALRELLSSIRARDEPSSSSSSGSPPDVQLPGSWYMIRRHFLDQYEDQAVPLTCDAETRAYVRRCHEMTWYDVFANSTAHILKQFYSLTDTNAMLQRGQMFVLSRDQFATMIGPRVAGGKYAASHGHSTAVLDVGAGDGEVTDVVRGLFDTSAATEVSRHMCRRLEARGVDMVVETGSLRPYEQFGEHAPSEPGGGFDVVTCFNVFDRVDRPSELLGQICDLIRPRDGLLVIAVVLPWCPFVENGTRKDQPSETLDIPVACPCRRGHIKMPVERCAKYFAERFLQRNGLRVVAISRVPYLCRGDAVKPYYMLQDFLFTCKLNKRADAVDEGPGEGLGARPEATAPRVASDT